MKVSDQKPFHEIVPQQESVTSTDKTIESHTSRAKTIASEHSTAKRVLQVKT